MTLSWLGWALVLGIGFPVLTIASGLIGARLRRRGSPYHPVLRHAQNLLLPMAVLFLFAVTVLEAEAGSLAPRVLLTITLLSALYVLLAFVAEVVFGAAPPDTVRARTPKLLRDIVIVLLVFVGGAIVLATVWEQDVAGLVTALGVGSIVLGFALQETLGNVMSGIALLMERPFSEGDFVEIDNVEGTVEEINWRATRLTNRLGDLVILPHSITSGARIVNNTSRDQSDAVLVNLGFGYEHPPNEVKAMLLEVMASTDGILDDPPPRAQTVDYGDSAVIYRAVFRVEHPLRKFPIRDDFMTRVWYAAQRRAITIPFPIRTVHHFDGETLGSERQTGAVLQDVAASLFGAQGLSAQQFDEWAKGARVQHFAGGEIAVRQGGTGSNLYVIIAGKAAVGVVRDGEASVLYTLGRGDFFGEATLFSGVASPYQVRAEGDLETLALNAATVNRIIDNKPSLAIQIGQMIETRRRDVAEARAGFA